MILVDENLSYRISSILRRTYEGIVHVSDVGLADEDDLILWEYALKNGLTVLTKDADFVRIQQINGFPPKIILLKSGNTPTKYVLGILKAMEVEIKSFINTKELGLLEII